MILSSPLSFAEAQAYTYAAKNSLATFYRNTGNTEKAQRLEQEAKDLKQMFNEHFWTKMKAGDREIEYLAMALDADGKPI